MKTITNSFTSNFILLFGLLAIHTGNTAYGQPNNIKNDIFWDTTNGKPIYSQGGGIFKFKDPRTNGEKYYWYGVHYEEAERYRKDPSVTLNRGNRFHSVTCYSSSDFVNWESEGDALTREESRKNGGPRGWPCGTSDPRGHKETRKVCAGFSLAIFLFGANVKRNRAAG